jgi:hypothetical protein
VRHQDRYGHGLEHVAGHAAEYDLPQPGMSVSAHDEQVEALVGGCGQDGRLDLGMIGLERDLSCRQAEAREPRSEAICRSLSYAGFIDAKDRQCIGFSE